MTTTTRHPEFSESVLHLANTIADQGHTSALSRDDLVDCLADLLWTLIDRYVDAHLR